MYNNHKILFGLSFLFIVVLFGCNKSEEQNLEQLNLNILEAYIDPEIQGVERAFMLEILAALPEDAREDVVHYEEGIYYTNRIANKGNITLIHKEEGSDTWLDQDGNVYPIALPSQAARPAEEPVIETLGAVTPLCRLDGTGIQFRMHTKPGGSSSSMPQLGGTSVKVTIPSRASGNLLVDDPTGYRKPNGDFIPYHCKYDVKKDNPDTQVVEPYGETPYVYLGGWGGSHPDSRVDAGLQFNCPTDPSGSFSEYTTALFFRQERFGAINDGRPNSFASGQQLDLKFRMTAKTHDYGSGGAGLIALLSITATGLSSSGTLQTKTISTTDPGWQFFGYDNIHSLNASIAQTPNAGSGNYYRSNSFFRAIKISNLKIIEPYYGNEYSWNGYSLSDPYTGTNGICKAPSTTTSGTDPIEIITSSPYSSNAASSAGIRVDLRAK